MKNSSTDLAKFCIEKIGVPYIMGTNGKVFSQPIYNDLTRRNPGGWFTARRLPAVRAQIGKRTTDCHGLIEWFLAELAGGKWSYDTTADGAFAAAQGKGAIGSIPELPGVCVRCPGHVGVYIGGGYVVEARGFDYGVCLTKLSERPWTHWYRHPKIRYAGTALPAPSPAKVGKTTDKYSIVWFQLALNRQIAAGELAGARPAAGQLRENRQGMPAAGGSFPEPLTVDGVYGSKTAAAAAAYWQRKGWSKKAEVWSVGENTVKALARM